MKVSVIVPIYNIENYIERCLRSLMAQTYSNIEIIGVDDGSTDASRKMLETVAAEEERILVLHKQNGGLSSARNYGMQHASGDFVLFVDGDDYLDISCVETLVNIASDKYNLVMFPYIKEYSKTSAKTPLGLPSETAVSGELIFKCLVGPDGQNPFVPVRIDHLNTAWGKLYRTSIIRDIQFVDTKEIDIEDAWFNMCVLSQNSVNAFYTEQTWYHYEKENMSSLLHQYKTDAEVKKWRLYNKIQKLLIELNMNELLPYLNRRIICEQFSILMNFCGSDMNASEIASRMKSLYLQHDYCKLYLDWNPKQLKLPWRFFYQLCKVQKFKTLIVLLRLAMKVRGAWA